MIAMARWIEPLRALERKVVRHPLILPLLFFAYLGAFVALAAILASLLHALPAPLNPARNKGLRLAAGFLVVAWLALAAGHYIRLVLISVRETVLLGLVLRRVGKALQVLLSIILVSAVFYYYLQLFSGGLAFQGIHPIGAAPDASGLDLLSHVPPVETVVDCLYFSVVTASTVGYGDIHPAAWYAKLAVVAQLAASFAVIVLALGAGAQVRD